jgi:adenosine deaminase
VKDEWRPRRRQTRQTAVQQAAALTVAELAQLARNSFQIAWLTPADRTPYLAALNTYLSTPPT